MRVIDMNGIQKHRTEEEMRKALSDLIHQKHTLHIPPEIDDADIVLGDTILELLKARRDNSWATRSFVASILQVSQKVVDEIEQLKQQYPDDLLPDKAKSLLQSLLVCFESIVEVCKAQAQKENEV